MEEASARPADKTPLPGRATSAKILSQSLIKKLPVTCDTGGVQEASTSSQDHLRPEHIISEKGDQKSSPKEFPAEEDTSTQTFQVTNKKFTNNKGACVPPNLDNDEDIQESEHAFLVENNRNHESSNEKCLEVVSEHIISEKGDRRPPPREFPAEDDTSTEQLFQVTNENFKQNKVACVPPSVDYAGDIQESEHRPSVDHENNANHVENGQLHTNGQEDFTENKGVCIQANVNNAGDFQESDDTLKNSAGHVEKSGQVLAHVSTGKERSQNTSAKDHSVKEDPSFSQTESISLEVDRISGNSSKGATDGVNKRKNRFQSKKVLFFGLFVIFLFILFAFVYFHANNLHSPARDQVQVEDGSCEHKKLKTENEVAFTQPNVDHENNANYVESIQLNAKDLHSHILKTSPGDLIAIQRFWGLYYHYVVYIGDGYVVHLTGGKHDWISCIKGRIKKEKLNDAIRPGDGNVIENESWEGKSPLPAEEIIERAQSRIGEQGFDLLFNNCEGFARWCRYGEPSSPQGDNLVYILKGIIVCVLYIIVDYVYMYFSGKLP